jgi:hypothetical protein
MVPAKRNSWKSTLEKEGIWKGIPFFCRKEVIPQDSWNWKAKKRNAKRNAQPSRRCAIQSSLHYGVPPQQAVHG